MKQNPSTVVGKILNKCHCLLSKVFSVEMCPVSWCQNVNIKTKIEREYFGIDSLDHKIMFGIFAVHHRVREDSTETLNCLDVHLNVVEKFN